MSVTQHEAYRDLCRRIYTRALKFKGDRGSLMVAADRVVRRIMLRYPHRFGRLP